LILKLLWPLLLLPLLLLLLLPLPLSGLLEASRLRAAARGAGPFRSPSVAK
jgi:hypothetical protein